MGAYEFLQRLHAAEDSINAALRRQGHYSWRWSASPNPAVPLLWNDIEVQEANGSVRLVAAVDYVAAN